MQPYHLWACLTPHQNLIIILLNSEIVSSGNANHVDRHFKFHDESRNANVTRGQGEGSISIKVITYALLFVSTNEPRMVFIIWAQSPIPSEHMSYLCPWLTTRLVVYHSNNIGVQLSRVTTYGPHDVDQQVWNPQNWFYRCTTKNYKVALMINNFTISVTSRHLAFKCTYYYHGMSMFNNVMRCMPMLHNGLQVG